MREKCIYLSISTGMIVRWIRTIRFRRTLTTLNGLSREAKFRLLIFLSRYIEGLDQPRKKPRLSRQDAALLTLIAWGRDESGNDRPECMLNQVQMAKLLHIPTKGQISEKLSALVTKGFCAPLGPEERSALGFTDNRSSYFRLTPAGARLLEDHAKSLLGLPAPVRENVSPMPEYRIIARHMNDTLERQLISKFQEARRQ